MQWKHPESSGLQKLKVVQSTGKAMCVLVFDCQRPLLLHFRTNGEMVTTAQYSKLLPTDLHMQSGRIIRTILQRGDIIPHDNTLLNMAQRTQDTISKMEW